MIQWRKRFSPIAVDAGSRCLKLVQLTGDGELHEAARWDTSQLAEQPPTADTFAEQLKQAFEGRQFKGREVVVCLGQDQLFLQNVRIPKQQSSRLSEQVEQELQGRLPNKLEETELRFIEAAEVRQGEVAMREVIVFGCHRPVLHAFLDGFARAGLQPIAVDVEPLALLRCYVNQCARSDDRNGRALYVHVGFARTSIVICEGDKLLFVKYIDIGGQHLDDAVASQFQLEPSAANNLRRNNRRSEHDADLAKGVTDSIRPIIAQLGQEIGMCLRYHSVTFRGTPVSRIVIGGGEANENLCDALSKALQQDCEISEPFRGFQQQPLGPTCQWDVAAGLAQREPSEGE